MKNWFRRNALYVILFAVAIFAGFGTYYYISSTLEEQVPPVGINQDEEEKITDVTDGSPAGSEEKEKKETEEAEVSTLRCPIDGAVLEELPQHRPLAVMIGNSVDARPVVGVSEADLVYEALVEGGITRLMAVYYHGEAGKIGSIRSARPYFVTLAQDTGAVYVHVGQSPQAEAFFKKYNIDHLNEIPITEGFWRTKDRVPPHNLFSSTDNLHRLAEKFDMDWTVQVAGLPLETEKPVITDDLRQSPEIIIYYPQQYSQVKYVYRKDTGDYLRYMGGKPYIDGSTNLQIRAKNIVVQYVDTKVIDGEGRLSMKVIGSGDALVFRDGIAYEARWEKTGLHEPTKFTTVNGEEIKFAPGQTWIQLVPTGTRVDY
ncbi:MAG: DUF3048 domain-containing protein [Thermoanaerobacteraceae bacterium]|nr:DUF3048 domain-containing protein [Thermoanaerobacteraceae bacterium]